MKKKYAYILVLTCLLASQVVLANDLTIENVNYDAQAKTLTFDISWKNAWYMNPDFHDGAWIFAKYKAANSNQWKHVDFTGATAEGGVMIIRNEEVGFMVYAPVLSGEPFDLAPRTFTISNVQPLTPGGMPVLNPSFKVFGVEMVHIPEGDFYAGDVESDNSIRSGSENTPRLITRQASRVFYQDGNDAVGNYDLLPDSYPNGYGDFYIMKYEVTQGMYAEFLNTLNKAQQQAMTGHNINGGEDYSRYAMSPYSNSNFYVASNNNYNVNDFTYIVGPEEAPAEYPITYSMDFTNSDAPGSAGDGYGKAATMLTPAQLINFLDWAGLQPMTELQYEKAARGFDQPVPGEYAWGTSNLTNIQNILNGGTDTEVASNTGEGLANIAFSPMRVGFAATGTTNRLSSGASYFGVMNLSDNALELTMPLRTGMEPTLFSTLGDGEIAPDASLSLRLTELSVRYKGGAILELERAVSDRSSSFVVDNAYKPNKLELVDLLWVRMGGRGVR